jgi:hypothetical protein
MRKLLSIFNFKTCFVEWPSITKAALFSLLFLGLLIVAARNVPWENRAMWHMELGRLITVVRQAADDKFVVLVSGSSRNGLGIHEPTLEESLHERDVDVVKGAMTAISALDLYMVMDKYDLFDRVDMIILDLEFFQFNLNCYSTHQEGEIFEFLGNANFGSIANQDKVKPWWTESLIGHRRPLRDWVKIFGPYPNQYPRMDEKWEVHKKLKSDFTEQCMTSEDTASRHAGNFVLAEGEIVAMNKLIQKCKEKKIRLIFNVPPAKSEFVDLVKNKYSLAYEAFHDILKQLSRDGNEVFITETFSSVDPDLERKSDQDLFLDYGHMTEAGAIRYSRFLGETICSNRLLDDSQKMVSSRR